MDVFNNLNMNNVFGDSSVTSYSIDFTSSNAPKNNNGLETSSGKIPSYSDLKKNQKEDVNYKPFSSNNLINVKQNPKPKPKVVKDPLSYSSYSSKLLKKISDPLSQMKPVATFGYPTNNKTSSSSSTKEVNTTKEAAPSKENPTITSNVENAQKDDITKKEDSSNAPIANETTPLNNNIGLNTNINVNPNIKSTNSSLMTSIFGNYTNPNTNTNINNNTPQVSNPNNLTDPLSAINTSNTTNLNNANNMMNMNMNMMNFMMMQNMQNMAKMQNNINNTTNMKNMQAMNFQSMALFTKQNYQNIFGSVAQNQANLSSNMSAYNMKPVANQQVKRNYNELNAVYKPGDLYSDTNLIREKCGIMKCEKIKDLTKAALNYPDKRYMGVLVLTDFRLIFQIENDKYLNYNYSDDYFKFPLFSIQKIEKVQDKKMSYDAYPLEITIKDTRVVKFHIWDQQRFYYNLSDAINPRSPIVWQIFAEEYNKANFKSQKLQMDGIFMILL